MLRTALVLCLVVLAACDSSDPEAVRIDGPNQIRATVNGEALVVDTLEIGWGIPDEGFQWHGAYCVPDDYPQNLTFQFEFPTVEPGTYAISRDASVGEPALYLLDSEGDATAGEYRAREGEPATVTITGVDRESGFIEGRFSGTFDLFRSTTITDARYYPDVLEIEDGRFTISLFQTLEPRRRNTCE